MHLHRMIWRRDCTQCYKYRVPIFFELPNFFPFANTVAWWAGLLKSLECLKFVCPVVFIKFVTFGSSVSSGAFRLCLEADRSFWPQNKLVMDLGRLNFRLRFVSGWRFELEPPDVFPPELELLRVSYSPPALGLAKLVMLLYLIWNIDGPWLTTTPPLVTSRDVMLGE